jgi:RNA polymerase sigma-70 factor (ECF subfamily)
MHHARDVHDNQLLEEGRYDVLLAGYFETIRQRCLVKLRGNRQEAEELAQQVALRLWKELTSGKRYRVPFRVVVHKVVDYAAAGFFPDRKIDDALPEQWDGGAPDELAAWEKEHDLARLLGDLPERQREVAELRYLHGLEPAEIASDLGIAPNAVYQALHNAHRNLRERLVA